MKLLRYGLRGAERPGILDANGQIRDLSGRIGDIAGDNLTPGGLQAIADIDVDTLPPVVGSPRIGARTRVAASCDHPVKGRGRRG